MNIKIKNIDIEIDFLDKNSNVITIPKKYRKNFQDVIENIPVIENSVKKEIRKRKLNKLKNE